MCVYMCLDVNNSLRFKVGTVAVAQLVERFLSILEVRSSNPAVRIFLQ